MEITVNLEEDLLNEALQLTKLKTQEKLLNLALTELIKSRRKHNLLDLAGQIQRICVKLVILLIDTSVWISVFRDRSAQVHQQLELLQGSLNEQEWTILSTYLKSQDLDAFNNWLW